MIVHIKVKCHSRLAVISCPAFCPSADNTAHTMAKADHELDDELRSFKEALTHRIYMQSSSMRKVGVDAAARILIINLGGRDPV